MTYAKAETTQRTAITYQEAKSACEDMIDINVLDTEDNPKYKILGGECVDREDVKH